jgi:hypothetical protein
MARRDLLAAGLLAALLVAWLLPMVNHGVDAHHDGIMLKPALDVLAGQALFRDTFTQYGALTTYLQATALWFQPTLLSLRYLTLAAHVVTLFFLYAAWRLILPRSLTVLSCAGFILFIPCYEKDWLGDYWMLMPWSSGFALMFQSVGLYALFRMILGGQPVRWAALLGATCASVFWCRLPVGLLMTGSVAVIWLALGWTRWTPKDASPGKVLGGLLGGLALVHGLMVIDVLLAEAGAEWWYQNLVWPRKWVAKEELLSWHSLTTVFVHPRAAAWLLALPLTTVGLRLAWRVRPGLPAWLAPACYIGLGGLLLWRHDEALAALALRDGGWTALMPLVVLAQGIISLVPVFGARDRPQTMEYYLVAAGTVLALGALPQYYPLPDPWHILWSVGPALGLVAFVFWRWLGWSAPVVAIVLAAAFLPAAVTKARSVADALHRPQVTLQDPAVLRGMKVLPEQAQLYGQIADTLAPVLRHRPDLPAVMIGNDALYLCFVSNRTNPLPYYVNWPGLADPADNERRWRYIGDVRPLIFFQKANWTAVGEFYKRERYVPLLYLHEMALEIAVPQEIADTLGVSTYGRVSPARSGSSNPR